jgi:hypothetical protein
MNAQLGKEGSKPQIKLVSGFSNQSLERNKIKILLH